VLADVGHDFNVTSEQDTGDYASTQWQVGGKVVVGMGASVSGSASYGKMDSHYASVTQASGIQAGSGGYQVMVGDTTHLVGGQLASTADPSLNLLDTGNLIADSVHNASKYSAVQVSVSGGSGGYGDHPQQPRPELERPHVGSGHARREWRDERLQRAEGGREPGGG